MERRLILHPSEGHQIDMYITVWYGRYEESSIIIQMITPCCLWRDVDSCTGEGVGRTCRTSIVRERRQRE